MWVCTLMFEFRSGTHGLNEELGGHKGREERKECLLCDDEYENISEVYSTLRNDFMCKLQELDLHFESLDSFLKTSLFCWVVICGRMDFIKDYIVDIWELRKTRLYDENLSIPQSQCQDSFGELGDVGDSGKLRCLHGKVDHHHFMYVYM